MPTKDPELKLAKKKLKQARKADFSIKRNKHREAAELLKKTFQESKNPEAQAWAWFELARVLSWLSASKSEVEAAFLKARELLPEEESFKKRYERWLSEVNKEPL